MKGRLHTDDFMQPIDQRKDGLRTERPLSHVFLLDAPILYPTLSVTDDAVNISPALEDERDIVQNAIDMAEGLDFALPKAAIPSAV